MKTMISSWGFGRKKLIAIIAGAVVVLIVVYFFVAAGSKGKYQFVSVTRGTITQTVSVTGNTTPIKSVDLSFPAGGTISGVFKAAGDAVHPGDVLVRLDTSALQAQLSQAQASVDAAQAQLDNLKAGPTPQTVQVSQSALATAAQSLANTYTSIPNTVSASYAKAVDAVENQVVALYNNPDSANPQLSFTVSDPQVVNDADAERVQVGKALSAWQAELSGLSVSTPTSTLVQVLANAANRLSTVTAMLNTDAAAVVDQIGLSASTVSAYKNSVAAALTEVATAASAVNTVQQGIASGQAAVVQAQAQLSQTLAGSTPQAIAAQQAQVEQAQASMQNIKVQIANATLSSPITGVVTVQNAKTGQVAIAGQKITSIISGSDLEVDAYVPETDIGRVALDDQVNMTFDAFPGETFSGKVFYIDPAETVQSGVVDYLVKVAFDKADARVKSGLTANLDIVAATHQDALILPQYAVIQNATGTFVDVVQNGKEAQIPVTLGIRDQNGNVEIASGVSEGQQVVNVGLKTQ